MIGINRYKTPPYLLEKIDLLYTLLMQGKKEYEQLADKIANKEMRRTVLNLARESNKYASELVAQIQTLGGTPPAGNNEPGIKDEFKDVKGEAAVITLCEKNEKKVLAAYRDILNESFLYQGLRKMIRCQLNELLCSFALIKQMVYLKFH